MELRELEIVAEISRSSSLEKAASTLELSQSALSYAVQRIEQRVGYRLFERQKRLTLTRAGMIYLRYAQEMLLIRERMYSSIEMIDGHYSCRFSLGLSPHLDMHILTDMYDSYLARWPHTRIDTKECYSMDGIDQVISGDLDIALGIQDRVLIRKYGLCFIPFQSIEYLLAVAKENVLSEGGLSRIELTDQIPCKDLIDFRDVPFIAYDRRAISGRAFTKNLFQKAGFDPLIINSTGSLTFTKSLIVRHNAYGFLPIDNIQGDEDLRCFRPNPLVIVRKGFYFKHSLKLSAPMACFLEMYAAESKKHYRLSAALHSETFSIPGNYLLNEEESHV